MTGIDEKTGLPVLPEGHFWQFERNALLIKHLTPGTGWSEWVEGARETNWRHGNGSYSVQERTRVIPGIGRWTKDRQIVENRWASRDFEREIFVKRFGEWECSFSGWYCIEPDPMTPENLLERACETLAEWETEQANRSILGNYPPKRFETKEAT